MSEKMWLVLGLLSQGIFGLRFVIQWIVSEMRGESVVPGVFWYLSVAGSIGLLAYAVYRQDPVFIIGQGLGIVIYSRNIALMRKKQ